MKATIHKLSKTSTWLLLLAVVLAGAGILIASTSGENDPLYGFTDQNCSQNYQYFNNMAEMNAYSEAPNGWKHNSYIKYSNPNKCVEVVRVKGKPDPKLEIERPEVELDPGTGGGGGGGGEHRPGETGGGGGAQPHKDVPPELGTDSMKTITDCWMNEAKKINLKAILKNGSQGYPYVWADPEDKTDAFGATFHDEQTIKLYPTRIAANKAKFVHLAVFAALHEWAHFLQAFDRQGNYVGQPTADRWFQNELDAHRLAGEWYRKLFDAEPPYDDFGGSILVGKLRSDSTYVKNKSTYVKLKNDKNRWQKQLDNPRSKLTTTEKTALKKKIAENEQKMKGMEPYFRKHANLLGSGFPNAEYDADADLGCISEGSSEDSS